MTEAQILSFYGRIGALKKAAQYDGAKATMRAREANWLRYERMVDPDGVLPARERARRANLAQREHMLRMSLASALKREASQKPARSKRKSA